MGKRPTGRRRDPKPRSGAKREGRPRPHPHGRSRSRPRTPGPSAEEGRVVAIESTTSVAQRVVVEDAEGRSIRVDCLGEPVALGARVRFERQAERGLGVLVRVLEDVRTEWVCTLRRFGDALVPVPFGGVELPRLVLAGGAVGPLPARGRRAKDAEPALREGDRVVVVREPDSASDSPGGRSKGKRAKSRVGTRSQPARTRDVARVRVVARLGQAGEPEADTRALVWKYRLPETFSRRARLEAEARPDEISSAERAVRLDLRHLPFVTIDPASARDHDDALCAEAMPSGAAAPERLWVAIADVSHFVAEGSFLDAEARRRGNSFYFPDRALPMLPERLSSTLCSLVPDVDRLALVVELQIGQAGEIAGVRFHEAVIRSRAKLAYEEAAAWLARPLGQGVAPHEPVWGDSLRRLARIAEALGRARRRGGAIELDLPEVEIEVDAAGRPVDARMRPRNRAHSLVEEAMLAANRAVAAALERAGQATLHRIHPPPDPRRLEALAALLERFGVEGFEAEGALVEPGAIAAMLARVAGSPAAERIHRATLRAMSQARYDAQSRGHFALQFAHYLHFTSPIRRYADLCVHRSLKRWLAHTSDSRPVAASAPATPATPATTDTAQSLALWLSGRERVAVDAEREAIAFACCALLAGREGESFAAEITGITEFGLFVRLESPVAEGLVPLRTLGRSWTLDPETETARRLGVGTPLEVGARIRVRLVDVDGDRGRLAFEWLEERSHARRAGPKAQGAESASERLSHSR